MATHRLDLFAYLLGEVQAVAALVDTLTHDVAVDDSSSLLLQFEGGVQATGAFNWNLGTAVDEFEICGTEGRLLSRNLGRGELEVTTAGKTEGFALPPPDYPHRNLVAHFVDCLRTGAPNRLPGEAGMQATRITEAAYQSAREHRLIRLA